MRNIVIASMCVNYFSPIATECNLRVFRLPHTVQCVFIFIRTHFLRLPFKFIRCKWAFSILLACQIPRQAQNKPASYKMRPNSWCVFSSPFSRYFTCVAFYSMHLSCAEINNKKIILISISRIAFIGTIRMRKQLDSVPWFEIQFLNFANEKWAKFTLWALESICKRSAISHSKKRLPISVSFHMVSAALLRVFPAHFFFFYHPLTHMRAYSILALIIVLRHFPATSTIKVCFITNNCWILQNPLWKKQIGTQRTVPLFWLDLDTKKEHKTSAFYQINMNDFRS